MGVKLSLTLNTSVLYYVLQSSTNNPPCKQVKYVQVYNVINAPRYCRTHSINIITGVNLNVRTHLSRSLYASHTIANKFPSQDVWRHTL